MLPIASKFRRKQKPYWKSHYATLLHGQNHDGYWPAVGPWSEGARAGPVFSTACGVLAMLAKEQFDATFLDANAKRRPGAYGVARKSLLALAKSENPRIAFAAHAALD
ncbi:MAG: hypothetical protein AAGD14_17810 [Planctomycetota bacterium]